MSQYRFKKNGKPMTSFHYDWDSVEWDMNSKPIYSAEEIARRLKKHFGRGWDLSPEAICQYFRANKNAGTKVRWPSTGSFITRYGQLSHNGLSEANYQKVLEVFENNTWPKLKEVPHANDVMPRTRRPNCLPSTTKDSPLFTHFDDRVIVCEGLDTPAAAEFLNACNLGRTYDANSVKDMCRDKRIPSAKLNDRHYIHKTNLEELVAEARRLKPAPVPAEDNQEQHYTPTGDIKLLLDEMAKIKADLASEYEWRKSVDRRIDNLSRDLADLKRLTQEEFTDTRNQIDEVSKKQTLTSSWLRENFSPEWKEAE